MKYKLIINPTKSYWSENDDDKSKLVQVMVRCRQAQGY